MHSMGGVHVSALVREVILLSSPLRKLLTKEHVGTMARTTTTRTRRMLSRDSCWVVWSLRLCLVCVSASSSDHRHLEGQSVDYNNVVCPVSGEYLSGQTVNGFDPVRRYTEISGLALSTTQVAPDTNNPVMYVINDGNDDMTGSGARIGLYDSGTGERLITLDIPNTTYTNSYDWETLAVGPCGHVDDPEATCLYVADVGDNVARSTQGRRSDRTDKSPYRIIKLREPFIQDLDLDQDNTTISVLSILPFDYHHSSSPTKVADCEAIFVDSTGWGVGGAVGDLYLVTKWSTEDTALTRLFHFPSIVWKGEEQNEGSVLPFYSPIAVGNYDADESGVLGSLQEHQWTGADMTSDGTIIALSDYYGTSLFLRCPGATVAEALTGSHIQSCHRFNHSSPGQVETTALSADGTKLLQIPEGARPLMGWTSLVYSNNDIFLKSATRAESLYVCPQLEWVYWGEGDMYCRSKTNKDIKPDEWCYFAQYTLDVVFEQVDPPPTKPTSTSNGGNDPTQLADGRGAYQTNPPMASSACRSGHSWHNVLEACALVIMAVVM
jgi:hypothetical protein